MNVALIRLDAEWAYHLGRNPALSQDYKLFIGQVIVPPEIARELTRGWDFIFHKVNKLYADKAKEELLFWLKHHNISHVLACQRLIWYSNIIEELCSELQLPLTWCELFFDNRIIVDKAGLQYCAKNDIHFESVGVPSDPELPTATRLRQPEGLAKEVIYKQYDVGDPDDVVVVLGQTPFDMSLLEYPMDCYEQWLDKLFKSNPKTKFLFKHHPICETISARKYPNVHEISENLYSLYTAFNNFAAFSSTTIFEGLIRRKKFVTGGYHLCSGKGLTIEPGITGTYLSGITKQLKEHVIPEEALQRRIWFLCNRYSIPLASPVLADRIVMTSEEFFNKYK